MCVCVCMGRGANNAGYSITQLGGAVGRRGGVPYPLSISSSSPDMLVSPIHTYIMSQHTARRRSNRCTRELSLSLA